LHEHVAAESDEPVISIEVDLRGRRCSRAWPMLVNFER
jgi:hypothetical protein